MFFPDKVRLKCRAIVFVVFINFYSLYYKKNLSLPLDLNNLIKDCIFKLQSYYPQINVTGISKTYLDALHSYGNRQ